MWSRSGAADALTRDYSLRMIGPERVMSYIRRVAGQAAVLRYGIRSVSPRTVGKVGNPGVERP